MSQGEDNGELPEGWVIASLGDGLIEDVQPGFACGAHTRGGSGTVPHLRPMNVSVQGTIDLADLKCVPESEVGSDARWLRPGDVLFNNTNSPALVGKTAFYSDPTPRAFSNHMTRLRCHTDSLDPKYCALALHSKWQEGYFESICNNHVSQASISRTVLLETQIALPPLVEQRRIVAKAEELVAQTNSARERLARVPAILKRIRQTILAASCDGRLMADWQTKAPSCDAATQLVERIISDRAHANGATRGRSIPAPPALRTDLELYELPETWCWVNLRFLVAPGESLCYGVVQPGENSPEGNFLVRAGDLDRGTVATEQLRRIPKEVDDRHGRSRLSGDEILVTVVGAGIGSVAIAPQSCRGFNIARAVAKVPIREVCAAYVFRWLQTPTAYAWMWNDAREVARPTLNIEQLETLPVPLPPMAEQHEIVRRVDALFKLADTIEANVAAATARADKLTQAILVKAFRGELVPTEAELARQDGREYEPAPRVHAEKRSEQESRRRPKVLATASRRRRE